MRKEIKPAVFCKECKRVTQPAVDETFCDECGRLTGVSTDKAYRSVEMTVFYEGRSDDTKKFDYCSWGCLMKGVKKHRKKPFQFMSVGFLIPPKNAVRKELSIDGFIALAENDEKCVNDECALRIKK